MNKKRLYTLWEKQGTTWARLTAMSFHLDSARRIFQDALIYQTYNGPDGPTTGELRLRPVPKA